jgi:hypothetical protein
VITRLKRKFAGELAPAPVLARASQPAQPACPVLSCTALLRAVLRKHAGPICWGECAGPACARCAAHSRSGESEMRRWAALMRANALTLPLPRAPALNPEPCAVPR